MHVAKMHDEGPLFGRYRLEAYDEMFEGPAQPRTHYASLYQRLIELGPDELERRHKVADLTMRQQGITLRSTAESRVSSESSRLTRSPG